ncbi:MAG: hypothetical protein AAF206_15935 [Bacteroidota bacterium]
MKKSSIILLSFLCCTLFGFAQENKPIKKTLIIGTSLEGKWTYLNASRNGAKVWEIGRSILETDIDQLRVQFEIEEYRLSEYYDRKRCFLVMTDFEGNIIESADCRRELFRCGADSCLSSCSGVFNSEPGITFSIDLAEGQRWPTGQYRLQMYVEGNLIGESMFLIL